MIIELIAVVALQSEMTCFSVSSIDVDMINLFQLDLAYIPGCVDLDSPSPSLSVQLKIQRDEFTLTCAYSNLQLYNTLKLTCNCEQSDSSCQSYKHNNIYADIESSRRNLPESFTYNLIIYIIDDQNSFSQTIYLKSVTKINYVAVFVPISVAIAAGIVYLVFTKLKKKEKVERVVTPKTSAQIRTEIMVPVEGGVSV
ncbi:Hypothetical_protein [Hexamita inflata]|uniref:Hypothetical_protein n=1 Tax=Hexamita inflata TaxID=28002 RepID=A0AA86NSQ0_9EUKA|nr:Hypothetical protein HINF_LOCUS12457 [Hexamita inflata]